MKTFRSTRRGRKGGGGGRRFRLRASNPTGRRFGRRRSNSGGAVARRSAGRQVVVRYPSRRRNPAGIFGSPAVMIGGAAVGGALAGFWVNNNADRIPLVGSYLRDAAARLSILPSTLLGIISLLAGWKWGGRNRPLVMGAGVGMLLPEAQGRLSGMGTNSAAPEARAPRTPATRAAELRARIEARRSELRALPRPPAQNEDIIPTTNKRAAVPAGVMGR